VIYLTKQRLRDLVADRCQISCVNFDFVYKRVLQQSPRTFDEFNVVIEDVLFKAYWGGEIKDLFHGMLGMAMSKEYTQAKRKCI